MSPKPPTTSKQGDRGQGVGATTAQVTAQVRDTTPAAIVALIATQLRRANDASERIDREGQVVRDMRGSVIAHPAIKIEQDATRLAADLLEKHKKRHA